jgi:predicted GIY-YIG superfamily endonuclease
MAWHVYILLCDQKTFYVGIAEDVEKRLVQHVSGFSPFTKKFSDFQLLYTEEYRTRQLAENREIQLKGWSVAKKKALISGNIEELKRLSRGQ